jgi:hypothetical protein
VERHPRPFTWHKSAEEILDRLAGYCRPLNKWRALQPDRTLGGVAAGLAALVADAGFASLRAPIKRVSTTHTPVPYARPLEEAITLGVARIVEAARLVLQQTLTSRTPAR